MIGMAMESLGAAARRIGAKLHGEDRGFSRVITDTRRLEPGDLFVALSGERFDGHDFLRRAASLGAAGAIVSRVIDCALPQIEVADALAALQAYGAAWRAQFDYPVIGVTGSNGKTTTKQLLAAVLAAKGPVLATDGNYNNHIGVPLTLCRLRAEHALAIIEMGANHAGEIAQLAQLARPTIGIVTQAGDAHLEGFGSREGVARAKGELFECLSADGTAIINADDAHAPLWRSLSAHARICSFGLGEADVSATDVQVGADGSSLVLVTPSGSAPVALPLAGAHNVVNALAAAAAGHVLGMSPMEIAAGLARAQGAAGRVSWKHAAHGARLIDDSYNANPTSMRAGLDLLAAQPGRRLAVLGGMGELGPQADALHEAVGRHARAAGIEQLYALGPMAPAYARGFGTGAKTFDAAEALIAALQAELDSDAVLLVKGSRSARMERVVAALSGETDKDNH
jgi:UDP-N-acetylmuramoyl-tripeptide--D-alanyl-D-alanine ligase